MNESIQKRSVTDYIPVLLFALVLSYVMYGIAMRQLPQELSDLNGHVYVYLAAFTGVSPLEGWKMAPYFLWHALVLFLNRVCLFPIDVSASAVCSLFLTGSYFVTVFMIERWCRHIDRKISPLLCGFISFALTILQPVWIGFLDAGAARGTGSFSINPLFNPTQMAARPFALICFMLMIDYFAIIDHPSDRNDSNVFFRGNRRMISILLSVFLFISALAKPVFAEMFIPAVGLIMLGKWITLIASKSGRAGKFFTGSLIPAFCIAIPCLLCILVQFSAYFLFGGSYGGGEGLIITGWLEVWSHFSENIPLSILLSMSFPILVLITDGRNFLRTSMGQLGTVSWLTGFIECALLGEGGEKLLHGDFIWPMLFGMLMLWAASLLHFLKMEKSASSMAARAVLIAGWILILIHLHYGFLYISENLGWTFFIF